MLLNNPRPQCGFQLPSYSGRLILCGTQPWKDRCVCETSIVPGEKLVAELRHVQQYQNRLLAGQMLFAELILTMGVFHIPGCGTYR